nr:unnamed protein product [Digitaria exilis]
MAGHEEEPVLAVAAVVGGLQSPSTTSPGAVLARAASTPGPPTTPPAARPRAACSRDPTSTRRLESPRCAPSPGVAPTPGVAPALDPPTEIGPTALPPRRETHVTALGRGGSPPRSGAPAVASNSARVAQSPVAITTTTSHPAVASGSVRVWWCGAIRLLQIRPDPNRLGVNDARRGAYASRVAAGLNSGGDVSGGACPCGGSWTAQMRWAPPPASDTARPATRPSPFCRQRRAAEEEGALKRAPATGGPSLNSQRL